MARKKRAPRTSGGLPTPAWPTSLRISRSRWTARGTHAGEISGIAATGKEVTVSGLTISTLVGGTVVEQWTTWDRLGMLVQLGAVPTATEA